MEQLTIMHDKGKIEAMAKRQVIVGIGMVLAGLASRFVIGGYIGAALVGGLVAGGVVMAAQGVYNRYKYMRLLENGAPIAVMTAEGILLKEPPYDYGLIRWSDMDDVTVVRKPKTVSYICPVLKRPDTFLYSLNSSNHRQAKMIKRIVGSYGAFMVATAAMEPEEIALQARIFLKNAPPAPEAEAEEQSE